LLLRVRPQTIICVGEFPNITHPQAFAGKNQGWFGKTMGPKVRMQ